MKKICTFILCIAFLCPILTARASSLPYDQIASEGVVVMDAETGQVLYQKNMDKRLYPASTTKIMTALLTVENAVPSDMTTISSSALDIDEPNSANVGLKAGEIISVESLLYGMMLRSANEAANALAEHVAGSQEEFAQMMTEKALEIGAVNTRFANANGLHDENHYTTAYDLALITRYAHQNEDFAKYYSTINYKMPATNKNPERTIENHLAMLFDVSPYYNETIIGGKIGFTDEARHTMSTVATKDGRTLVCVVLNAPTSREKYTDTDLLLDYCFNTYIAYTVPGDTFSEFAVSIGKEEDTPLGNAVLSYQEDVTLYLPGDVQRDALRIDYDVAPLFESEDDVAGYISFSLPQTDLPGLAPVLLRLPMDDSVLMNVVPTSASIDEKNGFSFSELVANAVPVLGGILLGGLVLFLFTLALRHHNLKKHRRRRMERMERRSRHPSDASPSLVSGAYRSSSRPYSRSNTTRSSYSRAGRTRSRSYRK